MKTFDERDIHNAYEKTKYSRSIFPGYSVKGKGYKREVPVGELNLVLAGQIINMSELEGLFNIGRNYSVEGQLVFEPQAGEVYQVKGMLTDVYSGIWIEDVNGNIVSDLVELYQSKTNEKHLEKIRASIYERGQGRINLSRKDKFLNIAGGETGDLIKSKIGEPDIITNEKLLIGTGNKIYIYNGLGKIIFSDEGRGENIYAEKVRPDYSLPISDILNLADYTGLRVFAIDFYHREQVSQEEMDAIAQAVWDKRDAIEPYTLDALAFFCLKIAKENGSRYRNLMERLLDESHAEKVKRYAGIVLESITKAEKNQFKPVSESNKHQGYDGNIYSLRE